MLLILDANNNKKIILIKNINQLMNKIKKILKKI